MKKKLLAVLMVCVMSLIVAALDITAFAADDDNAATGEKAKWTIMMYVCGSNLETNGGMASYNFHQILKANFSEDDDVKFVIMTGGSNKWKLESEYLCDPDNLGIATDNTGNHVVSGEYNQVWEARGADAAENPGKMVLVDADGVTGAKDKAVKSENELMTDPEVLKAFIDYSVANYPAEKYDLILWDHGGGPVSGYGADEHDTENKHMSFTGIVDAISDNNVVDTDDDGVQDSKFDFVDFDACLMGSVELNLVLADYADYYIASPETEPGYGQDYTGWLDQLGTDPEYDTFKLGEIIVDDFFAFYDSGEGVGQDGTLAVVDLQKLVATETGFVSTITEMADCMKEEAKTDSDTGDILCYDEMNSSWGAIHYGKDKNCDLMNYAALLGVAGIEITEADLESGNIEDTNSYTEVSKKLASIFQDDQIIYARGTDGIRSEDQLYRVTNGETEHGTLTTSGMYIFYPIMSRAGDDVADYIEAINGVTDTMPEGDRKTFLSKYADVMLDYSLITQASKAVSALLNDNGADKSEIDYAKVKEYWMESPADNPVTADQTIWDRSIKGLFDMRDGGESEAAKSWLNSIILKQVEDVIQKSSISADKIVSKDGHQYRVRIPDVKKAVVKGVDRKMMAELPALKAYVESLDGFMRQFVEIFAELSLGQIGGILNEDDSEVPAGQDEQSYHESRIRWYNEKGCVWDIPALEEKWYAINDADQTMHVASIYQEDENSYYVPAKYGTEEMVYLCFSKENGNRLEAILFSSGSGGMRQVNCEDLTSEEKVLPAISMSFFGARLPLPISEKSFVLNSTNWKSITLDYVAVDQIPDIRDTDGDGEALHSIVTITDIYRNTVDISDKIANPEAELIDIDMVEAEPVRTTGKELTPVLTYEGETLVEGEDYTWEKLGTSDEFIEPGVYTVHIRGKGRFAGRTNKDFCIYCAEDPIVSKLTGNNSGVRVQWKAVSSAPKYVVYKKVGNGKWNKLTVTTTTTYTDTRVTAGKKYSYRLRCVMDDEETFISSNNQKDSSITYAAVPEFSTFRNVATGIQVTWKKSTGAVKYRVYRKTGSGSWKAMVTTKGQKFIDKKVTAGKKYFYMVRCVTSDGKNFTSGFNKNGKPYVFVKRPTLKTVKSKAKGKMTVKWKKVSNSKGYQVQYSLKKNFKSNKKVTVNGAKKTSKKISKLKKKKIYYVRVRTCRKVGGKNYYSAWSKVKSVKTK